MISKKKLALFVLTGVLFVGITTTAYAQDIPTIGAGTENENATAFITKNLEFSEGLSVPEATFEFIVEADTDDAPKATIENITYGVTDEVRKGEPNAGKYTISKNSTITFDDFPHAGVYEYTVKEKKGDLTDITYSSKEYTLRVYVANRPDNSGETYIKTITAEEEENKTDNLLFTNTYSKNSGSLIIEKNTIGELADKTKEFEFTITFAQSSTSDQTVFTGKIGDQEIVCRAGEPTTFQLHDKQKLEFENLLVGTNYVVTEKGEEGDGYIPSITVIENSKLTVDDKKGNEKDDLSSSDEGADNLIGEKENKVTFTNTYQDIPITGIILNNIPFLLLLVLSAIAFGTLAVLKRRWTR